jgi:hypothetical protein
MNKFKELGSITYNPQLHNRFKSGELIEEWAAQYSQLFDERTISHARNQAHLGYHFAEWLTAILVWNSTGYLCLGKYFEPSGGRQVEIMHRLLPEDTSNLIENWHDHHCQPPDWLFYAPDFSDWFFCEVKRDRDKLSNKQLEYFAKITEVTGKQVYIFKLDSL